ncbi:DUF3868 domain-containing protein [Bacteroides sp. CR5/BHMF/2]|nr:DUF3868 domain-containing protein [Bacteroides sp. CR5/BHMF/2]
MKTKAFIFFSLLICNLLPAQNIKLDITPHFLGVRADSLLLSMDVSVEIENMESKNAVRLTPVLTGQEKKILLPSILLNGKQKQKLYLRNQILRKKAGIKKRMQPTSLPVSAKVIPAPSLTGLRCPQKIG